METRKMSLGLQSRAFSTAPSSLDVDKRTIDVTFSTGAQVRRATWFEGEFIEELSMKRSHVRLDRLNGGAPVLNAHRRYSLEDVIGSVVRGSAKIKNGVGLATMRFDDDQQDAKEGEVGKAEAVFRKFARGTLSSVSVGYKVYKVEEQKPLEDGTRHFLVTDWEPVEISPVPIPADAGAQAREDSDFYECEIIERKEEDMTTENKTEGQQAPAPEQVDVDKVRAEAIEAERTRAAEIRDTVSKAGLDAKRADEWIAEGKKIDEVRKLVIDEMAKDDQDKGQTSSQNVAVTRDQRDTIRSGMENAILHRSNSKAHKLTDVGREFRGLSMIDMARDCLEAAGVRTRGMSRNEIAKMVLRAGSHSTSDFPYILANVANKTLRDAYERAPRTWEPITRQVSVPDFKTVQRTQLGEGESLEEMGDSGEFPEGTIGEAKEEYNLKTYGKRITFSRKMLVNDDLNAFMRQPELFGRRAADLEADLVWAQLTANAAMGDGTDLFHADHGNLNIGTGASALAEDTLTAMWAAMRKQTGVDGAKIDIMPAFLIVPVALQVTAYKLVAATQPTEVGNENFFAGRVTPIAEPRLDDTSITAHYLAASADQTDIIELARLQGEEGPVIDSEEIFDVDGMKMKVRYDLGAKVIDWRPLQLNDGA